MARLDLRKSENIRRDLLREEEDKIRVMYARLADDARRQANALEGIEMYSAGIQQQYLRDMADQLIAAHDRVSADIEQRIPQVMEKASEAVVDDVKTWLQQVDMKIEGTMIHIPEDAVRAIITGQIYDPLPNGQPWTLSGSVWNNAVGFHDDINMIVANGMAANKSTIEIARDLEKYVDPLAKKPWDWGKVYPGSTQVIDYNAQRLARTLVAHAYQYTFVRTTRPNPFITAYQWHSVLQERTCELCEERHLQIYDKDSLPLDHPNGLCYWTAVIPDSMEDIADRIADWVGGESDPDLDTFADFLMAS